MTTTTTPRVYVGTFAKYSGGSIAGAWLDLEDYSDAEEFHAACLALHSDESDPELMFQDHEGIPEGMISESSLSADFCDWVQLDDDDKELLAVYREYVDQSGDIETARDSYMGTHDSAEDWAASYWEESGMLDSLPEHARNYIDFASWARDARFDGYVFARHDGSVWVFAPV